MGHGRAHIDQVDISKLHLLKALGTFFFKTESLQSSNTLTFLLPKLRNKSGIDRVQAFDGYLKPKRVNKSNCSKTHRIRKVGEIHSQCSI